MSMGAIIWVIAAALTAQAPTSRPAPAVVEISPAEVPALIEQLASPRFPAREKATEQLCTLSDAELPLLVQRYRDEKDYEVKRRIRYIIESIFHQNQLVGKNGFLGIRIVNPALPELKDPVSGRLTHGVAIRGVSDGFAAQRAGLQENDIIIAVNDEVLPDDSNTEAFVRWISGRKPGTYLKIRILRPGAERSEEIPIPADPSRLLEGAKTGNLSTVYDPTDAGVFLATVDAASPAAKAGFREREIIRKIEGVTLSAGNVGQTEAIIRTLRPGSTAVFRIARTEVLTLDARLGVRPPELADIKDVAEARSRFLRWWQEQGGELPPKPELINVNNVFVIRPQIQFQVQPAPRGVSTDTTLLP